MYRLMYVEKNDFSKQLYRHVWPIIMALFTKQKQLEIHIYYFFLIIFLYYYFFFVSGSIKKLQRHILFFC